MVEILQKGLLVVKRIKSIDQLLKETEKEAPKAAPNPPQKSADSSDDDFVSDDDEGMIYTFITVSITQPMMIVGRIIMLVTFSMLEVP